MRPHQCFTSGASSNIQGNEMSKLEEITDFFFKFLNPLQLHRSAFSFCQFNPKSFLDLCQNWRKAKTAKKKGIGGYVLTKEPSIPESVLPFVIVIAQSWAYFDQPQHFRATFR